MPSFAWTSGTKSPSVHPTVASPSRVHLAEATVKRHLANVNHKIGTSSRGEAARKALQEGWITIEEITQEEEEDEGGEEG